MDSSTATANIDPLNYGYRRRGVYLPIEEVIKKYRKSEFQKRAIILSRLTATLYFYWHKFASECILDIPKPGDLDRMYFVFLNCYRIFLWDLKANRRTNDRILKYWFGVRLRVWDKNMHIWKMISKCNESIKDDNFYDELTSLAFEIGKLGKEMELFATGAFNASEHVMHHEDSAKKGAEIRHAENKAMKKEVHAWLDSNMVNFKSMDAAAEYIAGNVAPVKWRTARSWVGEWKKLRSAGTL